MTAADDTGAWDRAAVWAHEAGHAEGETDILEAADSLYSYGWVHDEPSQLDTERWQAWRSEEHTSELQSLMRISYAVFCLNKKKQNIHDESHEIHQAKDEARSRHTERR